VLARYSSTPPSTSSLVEVSGCVFFGVWCSLFLSISNIPICIIVRKDGQNG